MSSGNKHSAFRISIVGLHDDLKRIVDDINNASWDEANEMTRFDVPSVSAYLKRQDTLFVTCYDNASTDRTPLGIASSRFEIKPYAEEKWLYVDELDVCANQRKKGTGTAIMQTLSGNCQKHRVLGGVARRRSKQYSGQCAVQLC